MRTPLTAEEIKKMIGTENWNYGTESNVKFTFRHMSCVLVRGLNDGIVLYETINEGVHIAYKKATIPEFVAAAITCGAVLHFTVNA